MRQTLLFLRQHFCDCSRQRQKYGYDKIIPSIFSLITLKPSIKGRFFLNALAGPNGEKSHLLN
jgi:hypothetical protein